MDNKTPIIYRRGKSNKVNDVNINNGQILITTDKGEMFVDTPDNKRIKITDNSKADIEYVDQKLANFDPQHTIAEKEYNPESEYAQSGIAVAEAVSNCSNAIRNTAQGKIVIINDLSPIDNKLNIELENPENNIYIFGKNLCPINSLRIVESAIVEEQKDSLSGLIILDNIKTHGRYTLSANIIRNEADIVTDPFMRIKINYNNGEASISTTNILENGKYSTSIETNETLNIQNIELYLCKYTTASSRDIDITNIQFEANGIPTDFEEYKPVQQNRITDIIKGYSPYTTIMANNSNIMCEYNQDLNKTAFVGKSTIYGGEIFNDYENNQALSAYSSANGSENTAGIRGFEVKEIDKTNNLLYLDSVIGLTEGDEYYSIANYDTTNEITELGTIQEINRFDNFIKVSILPKYKGYIIIPDKPLIGTISLGENSSVFGQDNKAYGFSSYAQGAGNIAFNHYAHSEGRDTKAYGHTSHTEGNSTIAVGVCAHAEGRTSQAIGEASHAENGAQAKGYYSHAEGVGFTGLLPEGDSSAQNGSYSHAEGQGKAYGQRSHAENSGSAKGVDSHAENNATASGPSSHAEGMGEASGSASHTENNGYATGDFSHAEGLTEARGEYSHSEGYENEAFGKYSHVEGSGSQATGDGSHAENQSTASGYYSHAENTAIAAGSFNHAENAGQTTSTAQRAHAENRGIAEAIDSHAEGTGIAKHTCSHAGGYATETGRESQTVIGKYNKITNDALFVVGDGSNANTKRNAFEVKDDGSAILRTQRYSYDAIARCEFIMENCLPKVNIKATIDPDENNIKTVEIENCIPTFQILGNIKQTKQDYRGLIAELVTLGNNNTSYSIYLYDYLISVPKVLSFNLENFGYNVNEQQGEYLTFTLYYEHMGIDASITLTSKDLIPVDQNNAKNTRYYLPKEHFESHPNYGIPTKLTIARGKDAPKSWCHLKYITIFDADQNGKLVKIPFSEIIEDIDIVERIFFKENHRPLVEEIYGNININTQEIENLFAPQDMQNVKRIFIYISGSKYVNYCDFNFTYYTSLRDEIQQLKQAIISLGGSI